MGLWCHVDRKRVYVNFQQPAMLLVLIIQAAQVGTMNSGRV